MIWVPSDSEAWEPAEVVKIEAKTITVRLVKDSNAIKRIQGDVNTFERVDLECLRDSYENLVDMPSLSEGNVLHHVRKRYAKNEIYTLVGDILVAVNPFKAMEESFYDNPMMEKMLVRVKKHAKGACGIAPHVFTVAGLALHKMRQDGEDQSVLISGESGAGKTETTKKILEFMSAMSGATASRAGLASVEKQILASNPLLESFGNAKTLKNNNSSRFGKHMLINFDKKHNIKGCSVVSYLLEKVRVSRQTKGERNYHIFYMLLAGASQEMRASLSLKPADQFYYLAQSGCLEVPRRSDQQEFAEVLESMGPDGLNVPADTQAALFRLTAAVLHLGNVQFTAGGGGGKGEDEGCRVKSLADCKKIAGYLGIGPDMLDKSLCYKLAKVNSETIKIGLSPEQAAAQRDALAKFVYGQVFEAVVRAVNSTLHRGKVTAGCNIGVLDIFGFEVFAVNSFEQLCINYCNERLQTFFNSVVFAAEKALYLTEGLSSAELDAIEFADNTGCVRLLDLKGAGIFAQLDEELSLPQGSDAKFCARVYSLYEESPRTRSEFYSRSKQNPVHFTIKHFAGPVTYDSAGFMEKNKDALADSLQVLVRSSSEAILTFGGPEDEEGGGSGSGSTNTSTKGKARSKKTSISLKFKTELDTLLATLQSTRPHFIRCIKPNGMAEPTKFDSPLVLAQLKCSGLFEAIRIRKCGFAVRVELRNFAKKYRYLVKGGSLPKATLKDPKQLCAAIMEEAMKQIAAAKAVPVPNQKDKDRGKSDKDKTDAAVAAAAYSYFVGNEHMLMKTQALKLQLDDLVAEAARENAAIPLQKTVRGWLIYRRYKALIGDIHAERDARRALEKTERSAMATEDAISAAAEEVFLNDVELQQQLKAAKEAKRRFEAEQIKSRERKAVLLIQRRLRGLQSRRLHRPGMFELMLERAIRSRDERQIERACVMPDMFGVTSPLIRTYQQASRALILELLNEEYVNSQLQEAIVVGSVEALRSALRLALQHAKMPYLRLIPAAKEALHSALQVRSVLTAITDATSRCNTVPKLLDHVDPILALMAKAASVGLAGELEVQRAAARLSRIANLIELRDRVRVAVELCAPRRIMALMEERGRLLRLYGPELLQMEADACVGMLGMLQYQCGIDGSAGIGAAATTPVLVASVLVPEDDVAEGTEAWPKDNNPAATILSAGFEEDSRLPPFARKVLDEMRTASSAERLQESTHRFVCLVPDEQLRRSYIRAFKWVVAFARWHYNRKDLVDRKGAAKELHTHKRESERDGDDSDHLSDHELLHMPATPTKPEVAKFSSSGYGQRNGNGNGNGNGQSQAPSSSSKAKLDSPSRSVKFFSPGKAGSSPGKAGSSPGKVSSSPGPGASGSTGTLFATRQARSTVVANETIKKGRAMNYENISIKTDKLIKQQIDDIEKFRKSVQRPTWTG